MAKKIDSAARLTLLRQALDGLKESDVIALLRDTEYSWLVIKPLTGSDHKRLEQFCLQMGYRNPRYTIRRRKDSLGHEFKNVTAIVVTPDGRQKVSSGEFESITEARKQASRKMLWHLRGQETSE